MIVVDARLIEEITQAAKKAFPHECCGLLAGTGNINRLVTITQVRASSNIALGSTRNRFEVDPKVHFDFIHALEGTKERIVGHYHSHPNHQAIPSEEDLKMAFDPKMLWVIISLNENRIKEVRAHKINQSGRAFQGVPLIVSRDHQ